MRYFFILIFIFLDILKVCGATTVFVSTNGSDSNPGTISLPFRTIKRCLVAVREVNKSMTSNIHIYFRKGIYTLSEPIVLDETISGRNGYEVIFSPYKGEQVTISGGVYVTDWHYYKDNIFSTKINIDKIFRQVYFSNKKGVRAREPNGCAYYRINSWDSQNKSIELKNDLRFDLEKLVNSEIHIQKHWNTDILRIESFTKTSNGISAKIKEPEASRTYNSVSPPKENDQPFHLENSKDFLDMDYEWFYDQETKELFVFDSKGDILKREVTIPRLENLLTIEGSKEFFVENVIIRGINFIYSGWSEPSEFGFVGLQAAAIIRDKWEVPLTAAVLMKYCTNLRFENNTFSFLGGNAITFSKGVNNVSIVGNRITDISGNGIVLDTELNPTPDSINAIFEIAISNNFISGVGNDYLGSVGIFGGYVSDVTIENNEIYNTPYSAITVGWGWRKSETFLKNNKIRKNIISNAMMKLDDGAGIYTLSKQKGTVIEENLLMNITRSKWAGKFNISGIYLDEGSDEIVVKKNIFSNVETDIYSSALAGNILKLDNFKIEASILNTNQILNYGLLKKFQHLRVTDDNDLSCDTKEASPMIQEINVFPNPASTTLSYALLFNQLLKKNCDIMIYNSLGKTVFKDIVKQENILIIDDIDINGLVNGIYLLTFRHKDRLIGIKRIIIAK